MSPTYKKVAGQSKGHLRIGSLPLKLWEGDDHFLAVETDGWISEEYRRIPFSEIRGIYMMPNKRRFWRIQVFLLSLVALTLIMVFTGVQDSEWWVAVVLGSPLILLLCWDIFRGPTCTFQIETRVQRLDITSMTRQRGARKFLAAYTPRIRAAQETAAAP